MGRKFTLTLNNTVNAETFIVFLMSLISIYWRNNINLAQNAVIMLDNAKIHQNLKVKEFV